MGTKMLKHMNTFFCHQSGPAMPKHLNYHWPSQNRWQISKFRASKALVHGSTKFKSLCLKIVYLHEYPSMSLLPANCT